MKRAALGVLAALILAAPAPVRAEAGEVRIAEQYGLAYLPIHVAIKHRLIEARAKANGVAVAGRHDTIDLPDLGPRRAIALHAPNGFLIEVFEKA